MSHSSDRSSQQLHCNSIVHCTPRANAGACARGAGAVQEVMHVWHIVRLSSQAQHTSANMLESGA